MQVKVFEQDKIIQELTEAFKQAIAVRDQLREQNGNLVKEADELRLTNKRKQWITERNEHHISDTTIDLVEGSDFEDDEFANRKDFTLTQNTELKHASGENALIEEFKKNLDSDEVSLFALVQGKFEQLLNDKVNDVKEKLHQEQLEKAELDCETNRLRKLLANVKCGSVEIMELRSELDKIHKKEMEKLRMYFERKCSDMEKQ